MKCLFAKFLSCCAVLLLPAVGRDFQWQWERQASGVTSSIRASKAVDGRLVSLRISDGGATWKSEKATPRMKEGEHAFAASGTHLTVAPGGDV